MKLSFKRKQFFVQIRGMDEVGRSLIITNHNSVIIYALQVLDIYISYNTMNNCVELDGKGGGVGKKSLNVVQISS